MGAGEKYSRQTTDKKLFQIVSFFYRLIIRISKKNKFEVHIVNKW
jgi:hypothetical protein